MPWDVKFHHGVWLPQIEWWLDAHFSQTRSFVSHAHSDHTATHREILCSAGTARLMRARLPGERREHILPFGQTEQLTNDCTVTLHPAGHIFGSAQCLLDHADHGTLLYTGDFKLRPGLSAEPCATPHADTLIMETTFALPHYVFPPTQKVLADIAHFCRETVDDGGTPVLFGYSLGKSQELLSGLATARLPVMLHPVTYRLTKIYEEFGLVFPPHREFSLPDVAGHVVLCPPQSRESSFVRKLPGARTAVITGWAIDPGAIYRYQCDAAFPLSDHADYPDLLRFVELVQPKRVLTLHGFAGEFARTLRDRGLEAWAIGEDNQLELSIPADGSVSAKPARPPVSPDLSTFTLQPSTSLPPAAFSRFAATADAVKATPSKLEKIELLRTYLAALAPDDAALAATFLTGRAFPQTDPRNLNLGWAVIKRAVLEHAGIDEAQYRAAYRRFADAGDATAALLAQSAPAQCHLLDDTSKMAACATLAELAAFFDRTATAGGPAPKLALFLEFLARRGEIPRQNHHRRPSHRPEGGAPRGGRRRLRQPAARSRARGQHAFRRHRRRHARRPQRLTRRHPARRFSSAAVHARQSRAHRRGDRRPLHRTRCAPRFRGRR